MWIVSGTRSGDRSGFEQIDVRRAFFFVRVFIRFLQNYAYNKCTLTAPSACLEMELFHRGGIIQSEWWLPYLAALLGLANTWYDRVEAPWTGWLKGRLDRALPLADHVSADAAQSGAAKPPLL